jgi:hemerythrin-like domain-containing protein
MVATETLKEEHKVVEEMLNILEEVWNKLSLGERNRYLRGEEDVVSQIIENGRAYIQLLRSHIDKENNVLYRLADTYLSAQKQKELLERFEELERERRGEGRHEELRKLLLDLKDIYLKEEENGN